MMGNRKEQLTNVNTLRTSVDLHSNYCCLSLKVNICGRIITLTFAITHLSMLYLNAELLVHHIKPVIESLRVELLYLFHAFFYRPAYLFAILVLIDQPCLFLNKVLQNSFRISVCKLSFETHENQC